MKRAQTPYNARDLRRQQTDAERKLWQHLRNRQMSGLKFRRQQPIGPYIADFYCSEVGLVIELDGGQHAELNNSHQDAERTTFLIEAGYRVLRFWNNDVLMNIEGVLYAVQQAADTPHPVPLPQGERGKDKGPFLKERV